jgi:hypothetical protein
MIGSGIREFRPGTHLTDITHRAITAIRKRSGHNQVANEKLHELDGRYIPKTDLTMHCDQKIQIGNGSVSTTELVRNLAIASPGRVAAAKWTAMTAAKLCSHMS